MTFVSKLAALAAFAALPSLAAAFEPVRAKDEFLSAITGKALTRTGISLTVTAAGKIEGRAFGRPVRGDWQWQDGYFCRSLFYGERNLGDNCQLVQRRGDTLRFTSDRGAGRYADLRLR
jgi:hypothetical protein